MASADIQWQGGIDAKAAWQHPPLPPNSGRQTSSKGQRGEGSLTSEKSKSALFSKRQLSATSRASKHHGLRSGTRGGSTLDVFSLEDVGGLPLEIWREVLSYLPIPLLCRCVQVCKSWRHLVNSLDTTAWRRHFLQSTEWKEPAWPTFDHRDKTKTWQSLFKEHYLASRIWSLGNKEPNHSQCLHGFRKKRERKILRVGPKYEHSSLKSALSVASDYDRIVLAPGMYDEQFEMSSKIPFELIGEGELGSVVLLTCIEQNAITARLCNLVLRAPWFTAHVLKVVNGHLQVDNCAIEDGQVSIISPGSAHFRYCSFVRTQVTCSHVTLSIIENSFFSECETCAVVVEGQPQGEANWAHKYLLHYSDTYKLRIPPLRKTQSCHEECSITEFDLGSVLSLNQTVTTGRTANAGTLSVASQSYFAPEQGINVTDTLSQLASEASTDTGEWDSESGTSEAAAGALPTYTAGQKPGPSWLTEDSLLPPLWDRDDLPDLGELLRQDNQLREQVTSVLGMVLRQCRITKGQGGVTVANKGALHIEQCDLCDLQYGIRCLQNAKVVILENSIHRCSTSGLFMRLGASGFVAGNDIHTTGEAGIDIRKQADPLIQYNRIHHSKRSGIVVLGSGRGTAKANDIYQNREAGIYILYKGDPYISENRICHGEAAGIAVTESGRGYIGGNLISGNRWGGIDVRRGADPRVTHNLICYGLADGIVIGTKGCGVIDANVVKGNLGCGIWVMSGQPIIQCNQIYSNKDSGIVLVHKDPDDNHSPEESESDSEAGTDSLVNRDGALADEMKLNSSSLGGPHVTQLKSNSVYHNSGHGLVANSNDSVLVSGNGFHGNRSTGVYIRQTAMVSLKDNSITSNAGAGVHLTAQCKVDLEGNGIYDNIGNGMLVAGEASVKKNDIFNNQMSAISVEAGSNIQVRENRLFAPYDPAILLEKDTCGTIEKNTIYEGKAQLAISQPSHISCRINDNTVIPSSEGGDIGVRRGSDSFLDDPPPRPHMEAPPPIAIPATPARHVTSVMHVMTPSGGSCQQGSKLCTIL